MALRALPVLDRLVLRKGRFLPAGGVLMAGIAKVLHRIPEEGILPGGVRVMAVLAGGLIDQGPVDPVPSERLVHHARMAPPAKLVTGSLDLERVRRGWVQVALVTHLFNNGRMNVCP